MRTTTIDLGDNGIVGIVQALIDTGAVHPGPEVERAIGYLSTWNMDGYPHCTIRRQDYDFVACYYRESDPDLTDYKTAPDYVIGAVWHGERYGFHS